MSFSSSLILPSSPSTTSSPSTSTSSSTSNFLRKLILRRPNIMSTSSTPTPSSSSSRAQPQQVRIVHRPAAPSLGPLSRPHSEWRAERSQDDEYRGRSGRRKEMRFNLPTPSTPVPIPTSKVFTTSPSTHLSASHQSSSSSSFEPSSPPTSSPRLSLHSIQIRIAAARSTSHSSSDSGSYSGSSAAFFDDDDEEDEEDFDSSASSSAFSFIDGEEMEGMERKSTTAPQDVMVRRASTDSQEEAFEQNLYFARKPSLIPNSHSHGFSLPTLNSSLPKSTVTVGDDELSFLSRQAQAKGARRSIAKGVGSWKSSGAGSFAISL